MTEKSLTDWLDYLRELPRSVKITPECFKFAKKRKSLKMRQIARYIGTSQAAMEQIVRGNKVSKYYLPYLCTLLEVEPEFLLGSVQDAGLEGIVEEAVEWDQLQTETFTRHGKEYVAFDSVELKNCIRRKMSLTYLAWITHPSSKTKEDAWRDYLRYWFEVGYMKKEMFDAIGEVINEREE